MGSCCSVSWEHQEALAWYAKSEQSTALSRRQVWHLVSAFRAIREAGKRNMYAMKNAKKDYDPRRLTVSGGAGVLMGRCSLMLLGVQKEHFAEWLPEHASFKAESLMFRAVVLAGAPSDGRPHLYPSEFCRMVERVCSVEGMDLARVMFDSLALTRFAGRRWIDLKPLLDNYTRDLKSGRVSRRGAGAAVGDLAIVMEYQEVLKHRTVRGMPVLIVSQEDREQAETCLTLREWLTMCRRTPQILWPAQWLQQHLRTQFFGERWWRSLAERSRRLGLPHDDDALEGVEKAESPPESELDASGTGKNTWKRDGGGLLRSIRTKLEEKAQSRVDAANATWETAQGEGGGASGGGEDDGVPRRRVTFADGTKAPAEEGAAKSLLRSPRGRGASDAEKGEGSDDVPLDELLSGIGLEDGDGVSALTAMVLKAERRKAVNDRAQALSEAAQRRLDGDEPPTDSKASVDSVSASLGAAATTMDFVAKTRLRTRLRQARGLRAPPRSVYDQVAAPDGAGIDVALGFTDQAPDQAAERPLRLLRPPPVETAHHPGATVGVGDSAPLVDDAVAGRSLVSAYRRPRVAATAVNAAMAFKDGGAKRGSVLRSHFIRMRHQGSPEGDSGDAVPPPAPVDSDPTPPPPRVERAPSKRQQAWKGHSGAMARATRNAVPSLSSRALSHIGKSRPSSPGKESGRGEGGVAGLTPTGSFTVSNSPSGSLVGMARPQNATSASPSAGVRVRVLGRPNGRRSRAHQQPQ
jgi:hypothetical protein